MGSRFCLHVRRFSTTGYDSIKKKKLVGFPFEDSLGFFSSFVWGRGGD